MPRTNGTTTQRGYGADHKAERARWQRRIDRGEQVECHATRCLRPGVPIVRGSEWDMGHTDDRTAWTGPEHRDCNRSAGAVKRNAGRRREERPWTRPSREW